MPLHGKIVVIKRSGVDGTEFPLTATCLFGRKPDCDIRIQLPQVSKEHCRIDLNENKEVVLTNLSSVNPTRVNGEVLQQSERLKHGDVITVIDRSFRFEYPPAPTPKKRSSTGNRPDFKVLKDQQVTEQSTGENRISAVSTGPQLKDGTNHDNIQRSLEKPMELECKEEEKAASPFKDLYQMIKKSLDVKTPRMSSISHLQTPSSRFCSPKPVSVKKNGFPGAVEINAINNGTPKSGKQRHLAQVTLNDTSMLEVQSAQSEAPQVQKRRSITPQRFTSSEVIEQVTAQTPKSTVRRSKEVTPAKQVVISPKTDSRTKASPTNSGNVKAVKVASKKRKSGELSADLPTSQMKKKRVSFGSNLSPELFDRRMPPDSPLRKGATPRRSFSLSKPKESLLRRVSVIGMIKEHPDYQSPAKMKTPSPKKSSSKTSPKTHLPGKKSPKAGSPSPKAETPRRETPKSRSSSPKAETPRKKTPKSKSPSPKAETPGKKPPKSKSPSPKAETPRKKTPKSKSPSPKAETPGKKTPKSKSPSPKAETPGKKTPKSKSPSPKAETPGKKTPKSKSPSPKAGTSRAGLSKSNSPSPVKGITPSGNKADISGVQTPTIKGRFSVSRINTPSPAAESGVSNEVCLVTVTPKLHLKRESMKRSSRKSAVRSSVKAICRKSGISRVSLKAMNSWAEIVKFGAKRAPVGGPVKTKVSRTTVKKTVSKPQTPASKLKDQVSTGHADSPATIIVGRAHRQKFAEPTGAAPRWISNVGLLKKDMKMDEDFTGISEMYKTPAIEKKQRSVMSENSPKTPVGDISKAVIEPSMLNTPEEPGEMIVSPLSVSTAVKDRSYNHEAVNRLFVGEHESTFVHEIPAMEVTCDFTGQSADLKTSANTPKQKPVLSKLSKQKTPRQKTEPLEDLRGKILKTPKQKIKQKECLTGVKRIMKTPRQKAEPLEDLRGKILKTPKQKVEQQECLTGVKRIMKTPRQKAEPLEDLRGKILKTPKQKIEQQECLTGVKRIMKTPKQTTEPLEDLRGKILKTPKQKIELQECLTGVKRIFSTPQRQPDDPQDNHLESHEVANSDHIDLAGTLASNISTSQSALVCLSSAPRVRAAPLKNIVGGKRLLKTPREKAEPVADNFGLKRLMKSPKLKGNAPVEDFEGLKELLKEPLPDPTEQQETNEVKDQTSDDAKGTNKNEVAVPDHNEEVPYKKQLSDTKTIQAAEESEVIKSDDSAVEKLKPETAVRGRRARKAEATDEQKETSSEESVIAAPVRGRRGKKTEVTAPPVVQRSTRGRNVKSSAVDVSVDQSSTLSSRVASKPKRGRNGKSASDDPAEIIPEVFAEDKIVQDCEVNFRPEASENLAAAEKPRRGRRTKQHDQLEDVPTTHSDGVSHSGKVSKSQEEFIPQPVIVTIESNKTNSSESTENDPQDLTIQEIAETNTAIIQKKSGRGRRAKLELRRVDDQVVLDHSETPASGNGTRGKKAESAERPTGRQTRSRNAKLPEFKSEQVVPEETVQESEDSTEAANVESSTLGLHHSEVPKKSTRGRRTKQALTKPLEAEPEKGEAVNKEQPTDDKPEKPNSTSGKITRGKRTKTDDVQNAAVEEEREQESVPAIRAKRGRITKQEHVEESIQSQEPVKNRGRARKVEQGPVEPSTVKNEQEMSKEAEAPVDTEPTTVETNMARRPRRAVKAAQQKQLAETDDSQKSAAMSVTDRPKRGKRCVEGEADEMPEENAEVKAEDENNGEFKATARKTRRTKIVKDDIPDFVPAKRACRGTILPPVKTSMECPEELPKRGRRAAKPSSEVAILSEELPTAVVEDTKLSKRRVMWRSDVEVFEFQNLTSVKPVRGKKSKVCNIVDTESKKDSSKTEEKDLSDKVEVPATKRAQRGRMTVEESTKGKKVESEMQPKTRSGRLVKK